MATMLKRVCMYCVCSEYVDKRLSDTIPDNEFICSVCYEKGLDRL